VHEVLDRLVDVLNDRPPAGIDRDRVRRAFESLVELLEDTE